MREQSKHIQAVREQLQKGDVRFTIELMTSYCRDDDGDWDWLPTIFKVHRDAKAISRWLDNELSKMNVAKWGPTCVTLYTHNMLGRKSVEKIKYSDINIIN